MATGCFDKDVHESVVLQNPDLYAVGRVGHDLNAKKIVQTLMSAITHSGILLCLTAFAFPSMDIHGAGDYYTFGTAVYTCLLVDMNYRAAFITVTHNQWTLGSIAASFALYVFYLYVYPCHQFITNMLAPNMYMVPWHMVTHSAFWLCVLSVPALAVTVDMFVVYCFNEFDPVNHKIFSLAQGKSQYKSVGSMEADRSESLISKESQGQIDLRDFAQQSTPSYNLIFDQRLLLRVLVAVGMTLLIFGSWAVSASANAKQIRIHYEGPDGYDPWGTQDFEVVRYQKECEHQRGKNMANTCRIDVQVSADMQPPILLYYAIGPFYQNFNDYLKSEVPKELHGDANVEGLRDTLCIKPTRIDADGNDIRPCGMKATSMFNDSFAVEGFTIDKSNLAWPEDLERYRNPSDYPDREKTSWLYERYPDVIDKDEGVNNEQFLVWMRPSALQRVWNPYGYIRDQSLKKGDTLTITIESNYPMDQMGGWKQLVLTTTGPLGGRHHGFGYCLFGGSVLCFSLCAVALFIGWCNRSKPPVHS
jgi:hypothetical protein